MLAVAAEENTRRLFAGKSTRHNLIGEEGDTSGKNAAGWLRRPRKRGTRKRRSFFKSLLER